MLTSGDIIGICLMCLAIAIAWNGTGTLLPVTIIAAIGAYFIATG